MRVELLDSVYQTECTDCGEKAVLIPNLDGLTAAVAITRAAEPIKLNGVEVRALRKSLGLTATELALVIQSAPETISRWEHGHLPINPKSESLLRMYVIMLLRNRAPMVDIDPKALLGAKCSPIRNGFDEEPMRFETVRTKVAGQRVEHWDTREALAA
jgi:DNA-binding transcriptional regulator YiaG